MSLRKKRCSRQFEGSPRIFLSLPTNHPFQIGPTDSLPIKTAINRRSQVSHKTNPAWRHIDVSDFTRWCRPNTEHPTQILSGARSIDRSSSMILGISLWPMGAFRQPSRCRFISVKLFGFLSLVANDRESYRSVGPSDEAKKEHTQAGRRLR